MTTTRFLSKPRIAVCFTLAAASCAPVDDPGARVDEILNGTLVPAEASGHVMVSGGCSSSLVRNGWLLTARHCVDTRHDSTFSGDGLTLTTVNEGGATQGLGYALKVDADDRAVVGGATNTVGGGSRLVLARYRVDGASDSTFGGNGVVVFDVPGSSSEGINGVFDVPGRYLTVGWGRVGSLYQVVLARFVSGSGAVDAGFGSGGATVSSFPAGMKPNAGRIWNGRLWVAGDVTSGASSQMALARFTLAGAPDTAWGAGGLRVFSLPPGISSASAVAVDFDGAGRAVLAGQVIQSGVKRIAVLRVDGQGAVDPSLAPRVIVPPQSVSSRATALRHDANGRIVLAGEAEIDGLPRVIVARLLDSTGAPDTGWGASGFARPFSGDVESHAGDMTLDTSGRAVVAGWAREGSGPTRFATARITASGQPDRSYGESYENGGELTDFGSALTEQATAVAVAPLSGRYVVAGHATVSGKNRLAVARYLSNQVDLVAPGPVPAVTATMGSQSRPIAEVHLHPGTLDVALLRLASPMTINGSNAGWSMPLYADTNASLVGQTLNCYGYGRNTFNTGAGTLRTAALTVSATTSAGYKLTPNAGGQIQWLGDSGGACVFNVPNGVPAVTGVQTTCGVQGSTVVFCTQVGAENIRDWVSTVLQ